MSNKMPVAEDKRVPLRFTQTDAETFAAVTNNDLPEWQRKFINAMWYARIPLTIWNDEFLHLSRKNANNLMKGKGIVVLDEQQQLIVQRLTLLANTLMQLNVLPCSDSKALTGIINVGAAALTNVLSE